MLNVVPRTLPVPLEDNEQSRRRVIRFHAACLTAFLLIPVATSSIAGCEPTFVEPTLVVPSLSKDETPVDIVFEPLNPTGTEVRVRLVLYDAVLAKKSVRSAADLAEHPWFQLRREDSSTQDGPVTGVLGSFRDEAEGLFFYPQFPLLAGEGYVAEFVPQIWDPSYGAAAAVMTAEYSVPPRPQGRVPEILGIYPSGGEVPANHLKFYVTFSEPMQPGKAWEHFQLVDLSTGEPVPRPFRHTELWSEDGRQLTLWFHPGRQKSGVNLNVEIGAILEEGRDYRLEIDNAWESLGGAQLETVPSRTFHAGPKDRDQPDLATWKLTLPESGSHAAFRLHFPEPLDWALLHSQLKVETAKGRPVFGQIQIKEEETVWEFRPEVAWQSEEYRLVVGSVLEDLAGNNLERPFEVDLNAGEQPDVGPFLSLRFRPK